jgi:hypothetical protein
MFTTSGEKPDSDGLDRKAAQSVRSDPSAGTTLRAEIPLPGSIDTPAGGGSEDSPPGQRRNEGEQCGTGVAKE